MNQQSLNTAISSQAHLMCQRFQFWWIIWDYVQRQSFLALSIFKKLFFVWFCLFRSYLSDEEHCFSSFCCGRIWQTWENTALFFVVVFFTSKGILHWRELWGVPACITALIKTLWEHCQHIHLLWSYIQMTRPRLEPNDIPNANPWLPVPTSLEKSTSPAPHKL